MMQDRDKTDRTQTLVKYAVITLSVLYFVAVFSVLGVAHHRRQVEIDRLAELDRVTLWNIVREVDTICDELGRVPQDQEELEALMGKPMPHTHRYTHPVKMLYYRTGDNSYFLTSFSTSGMRLYTSDRPEAGWEKMD